MEMEKCTKCGSKFNLFFNPFDDDEDDIGPKGMYCEECIEKHDQELLEKYNEE